MPEILEASLEFQTDTHLGEGPLWDEKNKKLWLVDILSRKLHQYDPYSGKNQSFDLGSQIGAVALREKGGLLLALKSGFAFFDESTGITSPVETAYNETEGTRFNDGKCDPAGRFWIGTLHYELEEGSGNLYCLDSNMNFEKKLDNVTIPNGMAWNRSEDRFYFIDTIPRKLFSFSYEKQTGRISNASVLVQFDEKDGYPDGMTMDIEGNLWISMYGGGKVVRVNPENGSVDTEIRLPVPKPTSCTFGGKDLKTLFITTCREHMSDEEINKAPLSGSVFRIDLPVEGKPANRFGN